MTTRYDIHERSSELEAVERWENEGGRLNQDRGYLLRAIREDYRHPRHMDQAMSIERLAKRDALNAPRSITTWIPVGETRSASGMRYEL